MDDFKLVFDKLDEVAGADESTFEATIAPTERAEFDDINELRAFAAVMREPVPILFTTT